jgi:LmbE family N-acetylglucosaminyl deacetylase
MARILAIHAHPDDVEILAGGTMALLASLGHEITIATMTPGDCGSHQYGPEEIAAIRRREAANAAKLIGASYVCVEFRDLAIFNDDSSRRRVTEVLRKTQPELVLTSAPADYHCDHEAASALVRDACFAAPAENYKTGDPAPAPRLERIPHLYFMDPVEGRDRNGAAVLPECIVDVSGVFPRKREMLAAHASQRNWLREHHGIDDYLNLMEQWTVARGQLAGLSHGEGFRLYATHPYPTSRLLEQLLGARAIPLAAATGV